MAAAVTGVIQRATRLLRPAQPPGGRLRLLLRAARKRPEISNPPIY
jgi:hypothetical protein